MLLPTMDCKVATWSLLFSYLVFVNLLVCTCGSNSSSVVAVRDVRVRVGQQQQQQQQHEEDSLRKFSSSNNNHRNRNVTDEAEEPIQRKWISQLLYEAERTFEMDANVNEECKRDFHTYKLHLRNQSVWAIRMMESSEWPAVGLFAGMVDHMGNFDECLSVSSHGINGQYCLAQANYHYSETLEFSDIQSKLPNEESSVWKTILAFQMNPVRVDRRKLTWALCIPASCTHMDLQAALNITLQPIFRSQNMSIAVQVNPMLCKVSEKEYTFSQGFYNVRLFFITLFLVILLSTCFDLVKNTTRTSRGDEKKPKDTRSIFIPLPKCPKNRLPWIKKITYRINARVVLQLMKEEMELLPVLPVHDQKKKNPITRNFRKLKKVGSGSEIAGLHFIKIVNIIFVIYGHRFIYFIGFPKFNTEAAELQYTASSIELIHTNVVDVFFMASGFLTFHFGFVPMLKGGGLYLFFSVLFRYIRMVPVFMVLMLYVIYVLPYTSYGPLWDYRVTNEVNNCKATWWVNLLAMSNVVKTDQQCLLISWYISTDIQLTIVGGLLLFIFTRYPKFGIFATIFTFLTCAAATFAVAYVNKYHGVLRLFMSLLEEPRKSTEFTNFYITAYTRAGPYLVGFMAGLIIKVMKDRQLKFSLMNSLLISAACIVIGEGSQYYGCLFYEYGRIYDRVESSLFAALNRSVFVLAYAVPMIMYFTSGLGVFNKLIEWKGYIPLGRLTYSVFLVNTVIQLFHAASQKQIMPTNTRMNLVWWVFGDIIWSYLIGLVLHLFVEAPVSNISKIFQRKILKFFVKTRSEESAKIDSTSSFNSDIGGKEKGDEIASYRANGGRINTGITNGNAQQHSYHNESYISNEILPKITESSRF